MSINYNNTNEILICGRKEDYAYMAEYLLNITNSITVELELTNDKYYPVSIEKLCFEINSTRELLFVHIIDNTLHIEGNKSSFGKLSNNVILPMSLLDDGCHVDLFYYEGNELIDNSDLLITFQSSKEIQIHK